MSEMRLINKVNEEMQIDPGGEKSELLYKRQKEKNTKITLKDFKLLAVLGRGGFGKVMLAEKIDTKEKFALKSIRKEDLIASN